MPYPSADNCCGCCESTIGTIFIVIYSVLRIVGPLVYLLLPVCRDVHGAGGAGGGLGYVLLALKLLEVVASVVHGIVGILVLITLSMGAADEDRVRSVFVYVTVVVATLLILYWVLHFINTLVVGCTFCTDYGGSSSTTAEFTLKNGYNERQCKSWSTTNNTGYLLLATFPLFAIIEGSLLYYFAAVVQGAY